ncbi:MAG: pyruvate formate lyase-activating protein [Lactobacillaceae bacterium]|jgi:pyruvate formate lyase activating enzyme|nr:pyruvate formate lyase-activating protein [Lactobacillaceae bacterium]
MNLDITARVHSQESAGAVDGPGLRYVIFLQGCPLRCKFCHNPDTWNIKGGEELSVRDLVNNVMKYKAFMQFSGGGVTVTGGEPLLQKKFIYELFSELKYKGVHTAIDTSGYTKIDDDLDKVLSVTDLVLLDLKHLNPKAHADLTGVGNDLVFEFLKLLHQKKIRTWIRYVVLAGINDSAVYAENFAKFIKEFDNVELVELLPYHEMGTDKWSQLGLKYQLSKENIPSREKLKEIADILAKYGIETHGA